MPTHLLRFPLKIPSLDETLLVITNTPLVASNFPINTLVARQWPMNTIFYTGLLDDSTQIIEFLTPARAQCKALAQQFDLDPNALSNASTDPFDIMLDKLLNTKKVTPKQLADALESRQVGHGQLAEKIILYKFSE